MSPPCRRGPLAEDASLRFGDASLSRGEVRQVLKQSHGRRSGTLLMGPFEELSDGLIDEVGMGNLTHVPKVLKLHELNSRQCVH
jgi:hypothetical protein